MEDDKKEPVEKPDTPPEKDDEWDVPEIKSSIDKCSLSIQIESEE